MARQVAFAHRYGGNGAVAVLDIDRLKLINDTFGHAAGDHALVATAQLMRDRLRSTDILARLGGDEFAIALPHTDRERAVALLQDLQQAVTGPRRPEAPGPEIGLSFGVALLYSQPIFDIATGRMSGREALLRMPAGDETLLPGAFLYTAERFDLARELDRWVIHHALRGIPAHPGEALAINLSAASVTDSTIPGFIGRELDGCEGDPASVIFEITETAAIANMDHSRTLVTEISDLGCKLALDDFGAGFGSFYYLKYLPLDYVKVDGEFIRHLPASRTDQVMLKAIVAMTHGLGQHAVAEHVEDAATLEILRRLGVDYGQGLSPRPARADLRAHQRPLSAVLVPPAGDAAAPRWSRPIPQSPITTAAWMPELTMVELDPLGHDCGMELMAALSELGADTAATHDRARPTVSVILPALNEEGSIGWVLEQIPPWVSEVVLVDGLSTDATDAIARRMCQDLVVVHQPQRGKGAALRAGFAAATGEIVVMLDADGSTDPREMERFVDALQDGADFVKGSRHREQGGSADFTRLRSAGNRTFVGLANLLYGSRFTDLCYGYCAFWRHHLEALALTADGFEIETQLVLNAVKAGLEIEEVPSYELPRRAGTSNLNAWRDGLRILRTMLGERVGRDSRGLAQPTPISLDRVRMVPTTLIGSPLPAEYERRRAERRRANVKMSGPIHPERRRAQRREAQSAVAIYRVVEHHATPLAV